MGSIIKKLKGVSVNIFFLVVLIISALSGKAGAVDQTYTLVSSATYCRVLVSTQSATQVDNYNGGCDGVLNGRNSVKITVPSAQSSVNCGFSSSVSTTPTSSRYGEEISSGTKVEFSLSNLVQLWCLSSSTQAASNCNVEQARPKIVLGE